jgi:hypothetical protein
MASGHRRANKPNLEGDRGLPTAVASDRVNRGIPLNPSARIGFAGPRVHLAMGRLLASGALGPEHVEEAEYRRDHNGNAARISLGILNEHARLTELGANVLGSLRAYLERSQA